MGMLDLLPKFKVVSSKNQAKNKPAEPENQEKIKESTEKVDGRINNGREFTDEDRLKAEITRKMNSIKKQRLQSIKDEIDELELLQQKAELEKLISQDFEEEDEEEDPEEDEEEDFETQVVKSIFQGFKQAPQGTGSPGLENGGGSSPLSPVSSIYQPLERVDLSDEGLNILINQNQAHVKLIQFMPDADIKNLLKNKFPQLSENTILRAVGLIKKRDFNGNQN